uniref:Uncharacterized protein n=1 Tax=Romanomermis culicivorax TaxID=13658 RepID=A0A915KU56_ROMCU
MNIIEKLKNQNSNSSNSRRFSAGNVICCKSDDSPPKISPISNKSVPYVNILPKIAGYRLSEFFRRHSSATLDGVREEQENGQTKKAVSQCQACGLIAHIDCRPYARFALHNLNCKDTHSSKSQSNLTDSREVVNLSAENLFISKKSYGKQQQETGKSAESLNSNNNNGNNYHQQIVDPIYLALKEGNKMASMRKQSLVGSEQNAVAVGVSGRTMESPIAGGSTNRMSPTESTTSLPKQEKPSKMKLAKIDNNEATSSKDPPFRNNSPGSVNNSRIGSPQLGSSPNLLSDKAAEISLEQKPTSKTVVSGKLTKRAPKLDVKLKSFSLDYSEASIAKKGE